MSSIFIDADLDGPVRAADLDRAIELLQSAEQARAEAAELLGGLAGTGLAEWLGYVSLERLLAHRTGAGNRASAEVIRAAKHLDRFEATAAAVRAGRITFSAVQVLARTAAGLRDAYARDEEQLLAAAQSQAYEELERLCRLWRDRADSETAATDAEHRFNQRGVWMQFAFDGSCHGRLNLDADGAEIVAQVLETSPDPINSMAEPRTLAQRRADALVDLCLSDGDGETGGELTGKAGDSGSAGSSPKVTVDVVIDIETLVGDSDPISRANTRAELARGGSISGPGLERLLCDASFRALVTGGPRTVLAYNRATPAIPPGLRRAVRVRDRCCTFTGCDRGPHWCDLHHIVPRSRGGPTAAENLTLLCRFHHTLIHEGGWQLSRAPDGEIVVNRQ